jgi:hypothetical protein
MTLVVSYDPRNKTTNALLASEKGPTAQLQSPGLILIDCLRRRPALGQLVSDPMLLPALAYGMWVDSLHYEHGKVAQELREVQAVTGLLDKYLHVQKMMTQDDIAYGNAHQKLVEQHAYLTNGVHDFVSSLSASALETQGKVALFCRTNSPAAGVPGGQGRFEDAEIKTYLEHMKIRTEVEMQRMLQRMDMYLQVVSGSDLDALVLDVL